MRNAETGTEKNKETRTFSYDGNARRSIRNRLADKRAVLMLLVLFHVTFSNADSIVEKHLREGKEFIRLNRFAQAADRFRAALQESPGHPESMYRLADTLEKAGETGEALELFRRLRHRSGGGKWTELAWSRCVDLEERTAEEELGRARSLLQEEETNSALEMLKRCHVRFPGTFAGTEAARMHDSLILEHVGDQMADAARDAGMTRIAVMEIAGAGGAGFADEVVSQLVGHPDLTVLERGRIRKIIEEQQFSVSDYAEREKSSVIGRLLGADCLVFGQTGKELSLRCVNASTGEIFASIRHSLLDPPGGKNTAERLDSIQGTSGALRVRIWTERGENAVYRFGETIRFFFEATRDCYVTLVDVRTSGTLYVLYPNAFSPDSFIEAGRVYSIPRKEDPFEITVGPPAGIEYVKILATEKPQSLLPPPGEGTSFFKISPGKKSISTTRDLEIKLKKTPPDRWAEDSTRFEIRS